MRKEKVKSLKVLKGDCIDATLLIIKLNRSDEKFRNTVGVGLIPYLAVVVEGIDKQIGIPMDNYKDIGRFSFEQLYKRSRVRTKIYSDERLNKNLNIIDSIIKKVYRDLINDYKFIQRTFIKFFGQEVLGVSFIEGRSFYNNLIGYRDLLEVLGIESMDEIQKEETNAVFTYSSYLSNYILKGFEMFGLDQNMFNDIKGISALITTKDYYLIPNKKNNIFKKRYDLKTSQFLYNVLCSINYVTHVLPLLVRKESNLYFRIKFICYYSSVESLDRLKKGYNQNSGVTDYQNELNEIIDKKKELNLKGNLRNNMYHYKIRENEFPESVLNAEDALDAILQFYTSLNKKELGHIIDDEYEKINRLITRWILQ